MKPSNEVDRLFREKLGTMQISPSSSSWLDLQKQLKPKKNRGKKAIWFSIAASLTLLMISLSIRKDRQSVFKVALISWPEACSPTPPIQWIEKEKSREDQEEKTQKKSLAYVIDPSNNGDVIYASDQKAEEIPFIKSKCDLAWLENTTVPIRNIHWNNEEQKILIRYVVSKDNQTSKNTLAKLLNYAQQVTPADILADIKNAKEEFMISKFNLDE